MTTVHKKRHGGIRRWLVRNSLSLALIGIILLSMTAGAIGCLAFLPKPQDTSTPETKTDGNVELALMRYNCGASGARKLWNQGIYSTNYSHSVMTLYESYKEKAANGAVTP